MSSAYKQCTNLKTETGTKGINFNQTITILLIYIPVRILSHLQSLSVQSDHPFRVCH